MQCLLIGNLQGSVVFFFIIIIIFLGGGQCVVKKQALFYELRGGSYLIIPS